MLLLTALLGWTSSAVQAQKFGYVDAQYILGKLPAYAAAQQEVNRMAANWQKEIEQKRKELDKLARDYRTEEVLLTDEMKAKRKAAMAKKEAEIKDYQQKTFGFEGTVFKKRQELLKPVQDQVFTAIEKVAKQKQLAIIFDKSGDVTMLYTNPTHDYTEYVLEELGLKPADQNTPGGQAPASAEQKVDLPGGSDEQKNDSPSPPGGEREEAPVPPGGKRP